MRDSIQFCKKYPTVLGERSTTVVSRKTVVHRYFLYSCPHPRMRIVKGFLVKTYVFVDLKLFKTTKLATPLILANIEVTNHSKIPKKDVTSCTLNL